MDHLSSNTYRSCHRLHISRSPYNTSRRHMQYLPHGCSIANAHDWSRSTRTCCLGSPSHRDSSALPQGSLPSEVGSHRSKHPSSCKNKVPSGCRLRLQSEPPPRRSVVQCRYRHHHHEPLAHRLSLRAKRSLRRMAQRPCPQQMMPQRLRLRQSLPRVSLSWFVRVLLAPAFARRRARCMMRGTPE